MKIFVSIFLILFAVLSFTPANAGIILDSVILDFEPGDKKYKDFNVTNTDHDAKAYVEITLTKVINPGQKDEKRVVVKDIKKSKLVVSPRKMILSPGGKKKIRVINLSKGNNNKEEIYRIKVVPVVGEVKSETSMLKILIGYEALAIIRPEKLEPKFTYKRTGKKIFFSNNGNTNVLIRKGEQCDAEGQNCKTISGKRLYPNTTWEVEIPYNQPIDFVYTIGKDLASIKL